MSWFKSKPIIKLTGQYELYRHKGQRDMILNFSTNYGSLGHVSLNFKPVDEQTKLFLSLLRMKINDHTAQDDLTEATRLDESADQFGLFTRPFQMELGLDK